MADEHYTDKMQPTYTAEKEQAYQRDHGEQARAQNGNGLGDPRFCLMVGTPEWEQWALSLPVDLTYQKPLQRPDGSFYPMEGFDD